MTVWESKMNRVRLLMQAAGRCAENGKWDMATMWARKAEQYLAYLAETYTVEEAGRELLKGKNQGGRK